VFLRNIRQNLCEKRFYNSVSDAIKVDGG